MNVCVYAQDMKDPSYLLKSVQQHFQLQEREEIFHVSYQSNDGKRSISFDVKGVKRELGQTLSSTGLTMYVYGVWCMLNAALLTLTLSSLHL
ncbi:hypothetical protein EON63_16550 [archaeon]|nr:MAG: hypothetical protein EON63_16550 [archaeon]